MRSRTFTRYVIAGCNRSGTTVMHVALRGHPNASALGDEIKVHPFFTLGIGAFTHGFETEDERKYGHLAIFDAITSVGATKDTIAIGMKTAFSSRLQAIEFVRSMQENLRGVKVILTIREDLVAQYGSWLRANMTGQWHSWSKVQVDPNPTLRIETDQFSHYAVECLAVVDELRDLHRTHEVCEVFYENDILVDLDGASHRLFEFLGLPSVEVDWLQRMKKVAPRPEDYIENYEELAACLEEVRRSRVPLPYSIRSRLRFRVSRLSRIAGRLVSALRQ